MATNKILAIGVFIAFAGVIGLTFYYQNLLYRNSLRELQLTVDKLNSENWELNRNLLSAERKLKICVNDWVDIVDDNTATAFDFKTTGLYSPLLEEISTNISLSGIKTTFVYKKQTAESYQINLPPAQKESPDNITLLVYKYTEDQEPIFDIYCTNAIPIPHACLVRKVELNTDEQPTISKKGYRLYKLEGLLGFRFMIDNAQDGKRRYVTIFWSGKNSTYNPQTLISLIDTIDVKKY